MKGAGDVFDAIKRIVTITTRHSSGCKVGCDTGTFGRIVCGIVAFTTRKDI